MEYIIMIILSLIIGYLFGSIPFALVIGKVFYNTDIRQFGSGNLGGTNTGRVLGKKAGISVMILDVLKVVIAAFVVTLIHPDYFLFAALGAGIGHCYPVFANFKGGKAVATMFGYLLALAIFTKSPLNFFIPLLFFITILYLYKMVSLSSILTGIFTAIFLLLTAPIQYFFITLCFAILIIYRHKENIQRIKSKTEKKITWM